MSRKNAPKPEAESAAKRRVIKKYPNRRLYDTATSTYITLADIKTLVMQVEDFLIQDAKTGQDLTRSILLQIILEEENAAGMPMFSEFVLANIIRTYGHAMQGFMGSYLERNMQLFNNMLTTGASGSLNDQVNQAQAWTQQSQQMLGQMQEQMLNLFRVKK